MKEKLLSFTGYTALSQTNFNIFCIINKRKKQGGKYKIRNNKHHCYLTNIYYLIIHNFFMISNTAK